VDDLQRTERSIETGAKKGLAPRANVAFAYNADMIGARPCLLPKANIGEPPEPPPEYR